MRVLRGFDLLFSWREVLFEWSRRMLEAPRPVWVLRDILVLTRYVGDALELLISSAGLTPWQNSCSSWSSWPMMGGSCRS